MSGPSSLLPPARVAQSRRWLLLGAVLAGLLAMRFLSGHDSAGDHRVLAPTASSQIVASTSVAHEVSTGNLATAVVMPTDRPAGHGAAIVTSCALLLLAVAVVALAGVAVRRQGRRPAAGWSVSAGGLRGPPKTLSRQALCVERI
ncbi:hypothetical protein SAMN04515671_4350 [Nakamurella panacisegetis]|uniref:Uncharacterized protein n=1 Tax=Nakamurella panacisegetis TaxID=1090615 RepID=A0A1H0SXY3_9ACTN|nr:hypothetical protein [Nakamurella panacisegetis]SDP46534.1 hypothetical protein SAMN04515671_4350 [Nakamurella panacisegetis]